MKMPAIVLQVLMLSSCSRLSVPSIADGGTLVTMTEENKFLLESGRSAFVDLGRKRGWLKISLVKQGWDHGTVTVFFSRTSEFAGDQQPYRIFVDELDPCLIDLKEFDVTIALTAGTKSGSHIELLWGSASRLFRRKSEEPNKAPEPTPGSVTPRATEGVSK